MLLLQMISKMMYMSFIMVTM